MHRVSFVIVSLSCMNLVGCGSESDKETGATTSITDVGLSPQSGNWEMTTATWADDGCNFAATLFPPSFVTFSDVEESSFSFTLYDADGIEIGDTGGTCTYVGDDVYDCDGFTQTLAFTDNGVIHMTGVATITMNSETSVSGSGVMTSDCSGTDCAMMAAQTNTGSFPCDTTLNWTAAAP